MKKIIAILLPLLVIFIAASMFTVIPVHAANTWFVDPVLGNDLTGIPAYQHIQYVINFVAFTGDTIMLAPGLYDEQVVIWYPLTIIGSGPATVIQPLGPWTLWNGGSGMSYNVVAGTFAGYTLVPIVLVGWTPGVTLFNFKVDGTHVNDPPGIQAFFGGGNTWPVGIVWGEASGVVQYVDVVNMNTAFPIGRSYGIWLDAVFTPNNVLVQNCAINGYYKNGIMATNPMLTFDIAANVVTGPGILGPGQVPNGIVICDGSTGTVRSNDVSNNYYYGGPGSPPANPWLSLGIMDYNSAGLAIYDNKVHDNDVGIGPATSDDIYGNQIYDCLWGIELEAGADLNTIHCNDFYRNTYGIHLLGSNSPYYTGPGDEPGINNIAFANNIYYNTVGVQNDDPIINLNFNAQGNWWGSTDGPGPVGPGSGDTVSLNVNFAGWLTTLATCAPHLHLTVSSAHDWPNPGVGIHDVPPEWSVTASVTSPETVGMTQYVCTGWTGTNSVPPSGSGITTTFTMHGDSSITWNWKTQYYLTVKTNPLGVASIAGQGWYDSTDTATLTAPWTSSGYWFQYWDVDGASQGMGTNPINVPMSAAHTATAHYFNSAVGGEWAPIDKLQLIAPYITIVAMLAAGFAAGSWRIRKHL